jgi:hypothetical protein
MRVKPYRIEFKTVGSFKPGVREAREDKDKGGFHEIPDRKRYPRGKENP